MRNYEEGKNATCLTERLGDEENFWNPNIYRFLALWKPALSVNQCITPTQTDAPYFERRKENAKLNFADGVLTQIVSSPEEFIRLLQETFGISLDYPGRKVNDKDIFWIRPDFVLCRPQDKTLFLLESKPFSYSKADAHQGSDGDYVKCIEYLKTRFGITAEFIFVVSVSHDDTLFRQFINLQNANVLDGKFGLIFLEDVFWEVHNNPGVIRDGLAESLGAYCGYEGQVRI